jgi:hypothetical protein
VLALSSQGASSPTPTVPSPPFHSSDLLHHHFLVSTRVPDSKFPRGCGTNRYTPYPVGSSSAAQAAKLLSLPRLAFGVAMTMALEDLDPMTFSSNSTITGDIDDALAHPATLSWGGVTLAILIQCVLLLLCTPTPTERSRFPFAEISALNCLWCLGVTMTLLSACLWIVTLTGTLPDTADPTRTIVCTVTGIFTLLSTSFQLSLSAARGQCLAQFFNTAVAVAPIALVVLTVIEWPTWWPNADAGESSSLFTEVLQVTLPLTLGLVALFIILTAARTTAASHRLQRERSRHRQHQFAPTTMRQQRSLLVNDEHRLPSPRTVLPHSSISGQPEGIPPRYADSLRSYSGHQGSPRRSWTSQNDHSAELMEAAELIVAEGLPPSYVEAVGTDARTSQPAVATPQEPRSGN